MHGLLIIAATIASVASCESNPRSTADEFGVITLNADDGVVFATGEIIPGDKFNQVDLLATENGDRIRLATGGPTTTKPNPIIWFESAGGMLETYSSLDEVPYDKPSSETGAAMLKTDTGLGFVLENYTSSGFTKGWIRSATASEVVIEYEIFE